MRILMTADAVGGVWTYSLDLARALAAHGIGVDLAVMGPSPMDTQRAEAASISGLHLHDRALKLEWMDDPWDDVARAGEWLLELAAARQPHVVHLNGYVHASLPFPAPVVVVAHSCVLSWWEAVFGGPAPDRWARYANAVAAGIHRASVVVAPTRAMAASVRTHYGAPTDLRVIPNGRCAAGFQASTLKQPFVFSAGRLWDDAKNVGALCAVASTLHWPVVMAGSDRAPDGIQLVPGGVHHAGRLDDDGMRTLFAGAGIYALPARYEPFGLSALEAGLSGCALVLGDIRSLREVWGDAAVFVPPDNRRALAGAINALIGDGSLRTSLAEQARRRAATYSDRRMAAAYADLYRELRRVPLAA